MRRRLLIAWTAAAAALPAQTGSQVLLVVNQNDAASREIAAYYRPRRAVPPRNVCTLRTTSDEEISLDTYLKTIERPIGDCLRAVGVEQILYIVTTLGVPLKVTGGGSGQSREEASVDSELTLLYGKLHGRTYQRAATEPNPFYLKRDDPFTHARFPMYLVTRLGGYDVADVKAMIDRSLTARNRGRFVVDCSSAEDGEGNGWLRTAAMLLPANRVLLEATPKVVYGERDVIGYAAWGSNDENRKQRHLGFAWLPGAIATEFVSTDARTFHRPPDTWQPGRNWSDRALHWVGSPQGLTADYIHDGATGCSGHVYEPYLQFCPRPDYLLPAYWQGRNLAESYWLSIPALSWQNVVIGDPLCSLGKPDHK